MAGVPIQRQPARLDDGVSALSTTPHIDERGRLVSFDLDASALMVLASEPYDSDNYDPDDDEVTT